jgi:YVTN family beta-propeller protein
MPCSLAVNADTNEVYVANYGDDSVKVIDGHLGTAIGKVAVGKHPQAIAVDPTKGLVYVANTQESTVSVIDVLTRRVVKTLNAGEHLYAIAVNTTAHIVHVANLSLVSSTVLGINDALVLLLRSLSAAYLSAIFGPSRLQPASCRP